MLPLFQKKKTTEEPLITAQPVFSKGVTKVRDYIKYVNGKPVHVSGYDVIRKPGKQEPPSQASRQSELPTPSASALSSSSPTRSSSSASPRSEAEEGRTQSVPVPAEFLEPDFWIDHQLTRDKLAGFHQAFNTAMASFLSKIGKQNEGRPFPSDLKYHRTFKESLEDFASAFIFQSFTDRFGNSVSMHPYTYFHLSGLGRYFEHIDRKALYTFANEYLSSRRESKNYDHNLQSAFINFEHRLEGITADRGILLHLSALPDILRDPDMVFAYPGKCVYLKLYNDSSGIMGRKNFPYKAVASLTTDSPTQSKRSYTSIANSIRSGKTAPADLVRTHLVWKRGQDTLTKSWGEKALDLNLDYYFLLTPQQFNTHAQKIFCYSR